MIADGGVPVDVEEAVDRLERRAPQYQEQYDHIKELQEKRGLLFDELRGARLYLDAKTIRKIQEYLKLGEVEYITDGGLMVDTFLLEFFRNLKDEKNHRKG